MNAPTDDETDDTTASGPSEPFGDLRKRNERHAKSGKVARTLDAAEAVHNRL